jgi:hypothetical protein
VRPVQHPKLYLLRLAAYIERYSSGLGASDRCLASKHHAVIGPGTPLSPLLSSVRFLWTCSPSSCLSLRVGVGVEEGLRNNIVIN